MSVPFTTIIQALEKGNVNDAATAAIAEAVDRLKATGKKQQVTVVVTLQAAGVDKNAKDLAIEKVWVDADIKLKLTPLPKASTLMFVEEDSNGLLKDAPQQSIHGVRSAG
jgi:hypothetical protein